MRNVLATISAILLIGLVDPLTASSAPPQQGELDRSKLPDSFKYYGPNGLWWKWSADQKIGPGAVL